MVVPVLIFVACFGAGVAAAARYLPELDRGPVGAIAFFVVCGLIGGALSLVGLELYALARELELRHGDLAFGGEGEIVAAIIREVVFESGSIVALAAIVYLLAPDAEFSALPSGPASTTLAESPDA